MLLMPSNPLLEEFVDNADILQKHNLNKNHEFLQTVVQTVSKENRI